LRCFVYMYFIMFGLEFAYRVRRKVCIIL